ncbi:hypothetical protein GT370_03480 [Acidocella sp. MX-AZ03]|uniref:hypothetical protein n=1 Tax=Acidocella sp. MX-AZ03 TaxID=2697363 RepID=UPI0022DE47C8|nr:hypothetical protein [Acidocella sp. MX-AZ03]WBO59947.1 hypothetical protein GT370_03480 [Acidocella sp. MX-AZ03]
MQDSSAVPSFYLYGESHRAAAPGFVHAEALDDRSRPRTGQSARMRIASWHS